MSTDSTSIERTTPRTTALVARDLSGCQLQVGWSHKHGVNSWFLLQATRTIQQ